MPTKLKHFSYVMIPNLHLLCYDSKTGSVYNCKGNFNGSSHTESSIYCICYRQTVSKFQIFCESLDSLRHFMKWLNFQAFHVMPGFEPQAFHEMPKSGAPNSFGLSPVTACSCESEFCEMPGIFRHFAKCLITQFACNIYILSNFLEFYLLSTVSSFLQAPQCHLINPHSTSTAQAIVTDITLTERQTIYQYPQGSLACHCV